MKLVMLELNSLSCFSKEEGELNESLCYQLSFPSSSVVNITKMSQYRFNMGWIMMLSWIFQFYKIIYSFKEILTQEDKANHKVSI
jgi:hypothetical protein